MAPLTPRARRVTWRPAVRSQLEEAKISQSGRTRQPIADGKSPTFAMPEGKVLQCEVRVGSPYVDKMLNISACYEGVGGYLAVISLCGQYESHVISASLSQRCGAVRRAGPVTCTSDLHGLPIAAALPSTTLTRHDPAISPRPLRRHNRHQARRGAAQQHRPGASCRRARLCPLLARRASQPRLRRESGAR